MAVLDQLQFMLSSSGQLTPAEALAQAKKGNTSGAVVTLADLAAQLEFGLEGAVATNTSVLLVTAGVG